MAQTKKTKGLTSIEPTSMTLPAHDRVDVAFAWFLDRMEVQTGASEGDLVLGCNYCGGTICTVEDGDTLRVLLHTALGHNCE